MEANAQAKLEVHDFESPPYGFKTEVVHVAVTKKYAKLSGDLNVQMKRPCKLCLSFLPLQLVAKQRNFKKRQI